MNQTSRQRYFSWVHIAILIIAILLAYSKIFDAGFISWDDADYVTRNVDVHAISFENISKWFCSFYVGNYHPLTMVSYAIDFMIGGQGPFIFHLTNILLHICNALILYAFINRLQGNKWVSFFVALIFAIHPVQTESVSWIAERKNVLYGFFFLLSLWFYTLYLTEEKKRYLLLLTITGIAAMLSKAAAVTLPVALLAVDIGLRRSMVQPRVWLEKLPLFAAAIVVGLVAINAQKEGAFLDQHATNGGFNTVVLAGYAYVQYIINLLVPAKLSVLYPYPKEVGFIHYLYLLISIGIIALSVIAYRRKWYMLCGGILFYTVNIALVLQFVQFGEVLMADRYLYIAGIGIWLLVVHYFFNWLVAKQKETIAIVSASIVSLVFLFVTYNRNRIWQSELQFWEAIVTTFPESSVAQSSVGGVYMMQGKYSEAISYIDEAIKLDANNYKAWYNKGVLHLRRGQLNEAAAALDRCLAIQEYPKALFSRALIYQQAGQPLKALNDIEIVLKYEPGNARAHFIKGNCLEQTGDAEGAIHSYNKAVAYDDNEPIFYMRRAVLKIQTGDYAGAIYDCSLIIDKNAENREAFYWRGMAKHEIHQMPCHDLNTARKLGYKPAQEALMQYCNAD